MTKTIEQLKIEADILKRAREGRRKEQVENVKKGIKKFAKQTDKNLQEFGKKSEKGFKRVGKVVKKISSGVGYRKSLSTNLINLYGGGGTRTSSSKRRVKEGPGRPRGDYKHRDPQTGQPIPATLFYKRIKEVKRQAEQSARLRDIRAVQELSKRGIPPSQAQQIVDSRQLQRVGVQPQQFQQVQMQPQRIPTQMSPEMQRQLFIQQLQRQQQPQTQLTPEQIRVLQMQRGTAVRQIWRRNPVVGREGGKLKIYGTPQSFWN